MVLFLLLTTVTFALFGFIIGIWANNFEKLQLIPLLIVTPLTFLGGSFYSIDMLPPFWRTVTLFNPVLYLVSGFRWSFYGVSDVNVGGQPRHDAGLPGALPRRGLVDIQDRLAAEGLGPGRPPCSRYRWKAELPSIGAMTARAPLKLSLLRDIGFFVWDPIGLLARGAAWDGKPFADEYDQHLLEMAGRLRRDWGAEEAIAYLMTAERDHMGFGERPGLRTRADAAVRLVQAYLDSIDGAG